MKSIAHQTSELIYIKYENMWKNRSYILIERTFLRFFYEKGIFAFVVMVSGVTRILLLTHKTRLVQDFWTRTRIFSYTLNTPKKFFNVYM